MRKKYLEENEKFELRTTFAENESFPVEQQNVDISISLRERLAGRDQLELEFYFLEIHNKCFPKIVYKSSYDYSICL